MQTEKTGAFVTESAGETRALGARLADKLCAGDVVLLSGAMGAGKSEFARGVARGLGLDGPIPSPSFTILCLYREGRLPLKHFDWYRLSGEDELYGAGLDEYVGGEGITLIEWHERAPGAVPETCLEVSLMVLEDGSRRIGFERRGAFRDILAEMEGGVA